MTDKPKALCDMTPEEAAPIMEAWRTGKPYECLSDALQRWAPAGVLRGDVAYRLPPTPIAPIVDPRVWQVLPDWVNWITRDAVEASAHNKWPHCEAEIWHSDGRMVNADCLSHLIQWPDDWRNCIAERPE